MDTFNVCDDTFSEDYRDLVRCNEVIDGIEKVINFVSFNHASFGSKLHVKFSTGDLIP